MKLTCKFTPKKIHNGPVAEASIEFWSDAGPLDGYQIAEFSIWPRKDGKAGFNATAPSRKWVNKDGKTCYSSYVRLRDDIHDDPNTPKSRSYELSNWIVTQYEAFLNNESTDTEEVPF